MVTYSEGIEYVLGLYSSDLPRYSRTIETGYECIQIRYPGYRGAGDYQLNYDNHPPTHQDVCKYLYELVRTSTESYTDIVMLLNDLYDNGTEILGQYLLMNVNEDLLITLLFWITLQDEINFPQDDGYEGRKMPFCRYFEAIYCAEFNSSFTIDDVLNRCNNKGYRPKLYNNLNNVPSFYR